jgi:1-deoxy-D-xylulose-5-phosphate reductoisomerase
VLNGADEMAVQLFLQGKIQYSMIAHLLEETLQAHHKNGLIAAPTLEEIRQLDHWARAFVSTAAKAVRV